MISPRPLNRRRTTLYFFALAFALSLCAPTLLEFRSDLPVLFGRYSTSYILVLASFGALVALSFGLGIYIRARQSGVRQIERLVHAVWRRPWLAGSLALFLTLAFGLLCAQLQTWVAAFQLRYVSLLLLGLASFFCLLIAGLLHPWLASGNAPRVLLNQPRLQLALIAFGSILIATLLFGNILNRQWWWFDDGNLQELLGPDHRVTLSEIPTTALNSEIGRAFAKARYRPTFWMYWIMEAAAWGNQPTLYYVERFVLLTVSIGLCWWLLTQAFGPGLGLLVTLWILSYPFWYDIWARLGAAETGAVPGLILFAFSMVILIRYYRAGQPEERRKKQGLWLLYFLSGIFTLGSKENMLILLLPNAIFLVYLWRQKKLDAPAWAAMLGVFAAGLFFAGSVLTGLFLAGRDIYGHSVAPGERTQVLWNGITRLAQDETLLILLALALFEILAAGLYLARKGTPAPRAPFFKSVKWFGFAALLLFLVYWSQYFFYDGAWAQDMRYDFPGRLVEPFFALAIGLLTINLLTILTTNPFPIQVVRLGMVLAVFGLICFRGFTALQTYIGQNVDSSRNFTSRLAAVTAALEQDPAMPLVFESYGYWDHEPVLTTAIFLRTDGIRNPFFVRVHPAFLSPAQPVELLNRQFLLDTSTKGYARNGLEYFTPLEQLGDGKCYSIGFSGTTFGKCFTLLRLFP